MAADPRSEGFPAAVGADARLLILGSLPGVASLAARQYYAHPRNGFWRLMGRVLDRDLVSLPYPERLDALMAARVGLWDVYASAMRPGSLDAAIREGEVSDLDGLVSRLPDLRAVAFNGKTAARIGRRLLRDRTRIALIDLPSSSPAHAAMTFSQKAERWSALAREL